MSIAARSSVYGPNVVAAATTTTGANAPAHDIAAADGGGVKRKWGEIPATEAPPAARSGSTSPTAPPAPSGPLRTLKVKPHIPPVTVTLPSTNPAYS